MCLYSDELLKSCTGCRLSELNVGVRYLVHGDERSGILHSEGFVQAQCLKVDMQLNAQVLAFLLRRRRIMAFAPCGTGIRLLISSKTVTESN